MGSGDLNMKKSWHPLTQANQRRVAEEKRKAEEEAQRTARIQKELREERQKEEMDMLNASTSKKPINKLDWMYSAPSSSGPQNSEELEAYLLGKKSISAIVDRNDAASQVKDQDKWKDGLFAFSNRNANSERDIMAKNMEDPLMDIKRREQAATQAMLKTSGTNKVDLASDRPRREKRSEDGSSSKRHKRREREADDERGEQKSSRRHHKSHRHKHEREISEERERPRKTHRREVGEDHERLKEPRQSRSRRSRSPPAHRSRH